MRPMSRRAAPWRRAPVPGPRRTSPLLARVTVVREVPFQFDDAWFTTVASSVLHSTGRTSPAGIAILLSDDETLRRLNRTYRGHDYATDVLSFSAGDPSASTFIGDVALSVPRVIDQADMYGHGLAREAGYLVVHGILHLLGHDHETDEDQRVMRAAEEDALAIVGLGRPPTSTED